MCIALGLASTALILRSSSWSAGPRRIPSRTLASALLHWALCTPPAALSHHHSARQHSCSYRLHAAGFSRCWLLVGSFGALNPGGEGLKLGIDDECGWELFLVILEGELVFLLLRHRHPVCSLSDPSALGSVGFQQVLSYVTMKTALAEVIALPMLALVVE